MFQKIFGREAPLWEFLINALRLIALSCLFVLCSLPLLTVIPASVALYSAVTKHLRPGTPGVFGCFFREYWRTLLKGILTELVWLFVAVVPVFGFFLFMMQTGFSLVGFVYCFTLMIPLGVLAWLPPIISRTGCGFWAAHKQALDIALRHIFYSLALVLLAVPAILLCVNLPYLLLIVPGLLCLIQSFLTERIFAQALEL